MKKTLTGRKLSEEHEQKKLKRVGKGKKIMAFSIKSKS